MIMLIKRDRDTELCCQAVYLTVPCTAPRAPTATNRWQNIKKKKKKKRTHLLAEIQTQASLPHLLHICMELAAKRKIFVKVMDYLLGFPIFFNNFSNFPRACESPQCKLFDPCHCLYNKL